MATFLGDEVLGGNFAIGNFKTSKFTTTIKVPTYVFLRRLFSVEWAPARHTLFEVLTVSHLLILQSANRKHSQRQSESSATGRIPYCAYS